MEKWENLADDIIAFCMKWGLWNSVIVWTKGKKIASYEDEIPEEINGPKPENLTMYYEGETALAYLFGHGKYCVELQDVSEEAFEFILQYEDFDCDDITPDSYETGELEFEPTLEKWEFDSYNEFEQLEWEIDHERLIEIKSEKRDERVSYKRGTEVYSKVMEEFNAVLEKYNVGYDPYDGGYDIGLHFYEKYTDLVDNSM